jgi:hypothetical protein
VGAGRQGHDVITAVPLGLHVPADAHTALGQLRRQADVGEEFLRRDQLLLALPVLGALLLERLQRRAGAGALLKGSPRVVIEHGLEDLNANRLVGRVRDVHHQGEAVE